MRAARPLLALAAALLLAPALSACGYSVGFKARDGIESVAVPVFENRSLRREVEFALTESVVREVQRRTPLRVVPQERADVTLLGTIESFEQRVLVEGSIDQVLESAVVISVGVVGVDKHGKELFRYTGDGHARGATGPAIVETAQFEGSTGAPLEKGTQDAFTDIAERIVMLLEARRAPRRASPDEGPR